MTLRPGVRRGLRILAGAVLIAVALLPSSLPGFRSPAPALAGSGGCSPSSSTCFLFDVQLGSGPGVGTGFGAYRTKNPIDATYTRIVCEYGNETQTGVCGWGYEVGSPGDGFKVLYSLLPDPGSQACQGGICYGAEEFEGFIDIFGNYLDSSWSFELINHVQIDVLVQGTGSGTVTSDPAGIDCPDDCDDLFAAGLPVTLTATPDPGSVFARWEGDCTGTDSACVVTPEFLQTVTPRFDKEATAPPPTKTPTKAPTDAPTDEPPEEVTPEPTASITQPASPTEPAMSAASTLMPSAESSPSAVPSTAPAANAGTLPLVAGLAILLVILVGGAVFFARRGRAPAS